MESAQLSKKSILAVSLLLLLSRGEIVLFLSK